ncbi:hypothetical protein NIES2101_26815 [Calothrix sp. HK-06]|nr:hypothetical protein NIES2101_26815 [Calothrix sp. HK-06]
MERNYTDGDYMEVFASDWKDVVCDKNGTLDLDKVARELRDYSLLIDCTSLVYDNICNVSAPFTKPEHIIDAIDESIERRAEELLQEKIVDTLGTLTKTEHNQSWDYGVIYRQLQGASKTLIALLNYLAQQDSATMASIAAVSMKLVEISGEITKTHKTFEQIAIDICAK